MGAIVAVVVVILIVVVGVAAVVSSRSDPSEEANGDTSSTAAASEPSGPPPTAPGASTGPTSSPSPTTAPPTTVPPTTAPPPPSEPGGVPSGLFCRDLAARGFSYSAAVAYWNQEGNPDRLDEDLNGIPCETVYSASEVASIFGGAPGGLPSGLFCRDLAAQGLSYASAVAYWNQEGNPDRMDEDLNGIPCETVYSAAEIQSVFG